MKRMKHEEERGKQTKERKREKRDRVNMKSRGRRMETVNEHQESSHLHLCEAVTYQSHSPPLTIQSLPSLAVIALTQITDLTLWTHLGGGLGCLLV